MPLIEDIKIPLNRFICADKAFKTTVSKRIMNRAFGLFSELDTIFS